MLLVDRLVTSVLKAIYLVNGEKNRIESPKAKVKQNKETDEIDQIFSSCVVANKSHSSTFEEKVSQPINICVRNAIVNYVGSSKGGTSKQTTST